MKPGDWIGVDLDGTLAYYEKWRGVDYIGPPVPAMLERVCRWLAEGREVRIMTARVGKGLRSPEEAQQAEAAIRNWCRRYVGCELVVTAEKDWGMVELWDDRVVAVRKNTGEPLNPSVLEEAAQ